MLAQPDHVFHHTDTARLPFILDSGLLKPGVNRIGGFPEPDFVWASTNPKGDATASADCGEHYRAGKVRHVRFTLPRGLMFPWAEVPGRYPAWTMEHIRRLEAAAAGKSAPSTWWCSLAPIPLSDVAAVHTRSYHDNRWLPFNIGTEVIETMQGAERWLSVVVEGTPFASTRTVLGGIYAGAEGYKVGIGPISPVMEIRPQADRDGYLRSLVDLAEKLRPEIGDDHSLARRTVMASKADVACAVWRDLTRPSGFSMLLLKGEGRLENIAGTGRSALTSITEPRCREVQP